MHYVQILLRQKFNVPHHHGMQRYLITYSHHYISSSLHGKLTETSGKTCTVVCLSYLHCIAHGKWVCKKYGSRGSCDKTFFDRLRVFYS